MKKALIIFILLLTTYLVFSKLMDNKSAEHTTDTKIAALDSKEINDNKVTEDVKETLIEPPTKSFKSDFIDITYGAVLDNEEIEAVLKFTFSLDGTFTDTRQMTHPKSMSGVTNGTYKINGPELELTYTDDRDNDIFKFSKTMMILQKDGSLRTGTVILTAQ